MFGFLRKKTFWTNRSLCAVSIRCCASWARWKVSVAGAEVRLFGSVGPTPGNRVQCWSSAETGGRILPLNRRRPEGTKHFTRETLLCSHRKLLVRSKCALWKLYFASSSKMVWTVCFLHSVRWIQWSSVEVVFLLLFWHDENNSLLY